ncbi:hypothetical protein ACOAOT_04075 [Lacrimispora sp. AGF001]|uniref:hypothetical protein n=1 Tax=Lacrimispora sp. AGF001 TaxID=3401631 RepID=UPI003B43246E
MNEEKIIDDVVELWKIICTYGAIDEKYYDKDLIKELKIALGGKHNESIETILSTNNISLEKFISEFFKVTKSFSEMLNGLLEMFEEANAYTSDHNINLEFNFNTSKCFSFDINHFKSMKEQVQKIEKEFVYLYISELVSWGLIDPFRKVTNWQSKITDIKAINWLKEYDENKWPKSLLECPQTGNNELDEYIVKVWNIWDIFLNECKRVFDNPNDAKAKRAENEEWPFYYLLLDKWPYIFVDNLFKFTYYFDILNEAEKLALSKKVIESLNEIFNYSSITKDKHKVWEKTIKEFLKLPVWKHRYELYSVWVCTEIMGALDKYNIEYNVIDGKLSFSFGGSHIASIVNSHPELQIWAELKTEWEKGETKNRKSRGKHIQPDYSLVVLPIEDVRSTLVVVECKQYKKPSRKNFSEALEDYADGRPESKVILVNYGKIPSKLIEKIESENKSRMLAFGKFIPRSTEIAEFKNQIITTIDKYYNSPGKTIISNYMLDTSEELSIILEWNEKPRDLDLSLIIKDVNDSMEISYKNSGKKEQFPFCEYKVDVRNGFGPEEIIISKWLNKDYTIIVHNFSKEVDLQASSARITLRQGIKEYQIDIANNSENGEVWEVGIIRGSTGELVQLNNIVKTFNED